MRKYQRQEDEEVEEPTDVLMDNQGTQPDTGDSDCMFVEVLRNRRPTACPCKLARNKPQSKQPRQPDQCQVQGGASGYWDDLSGKPLEAELVKKAREEEMAEVRKHNVYKKIISI